MISRSLKIGRASEVDTWRHMVLSLEDRIKTYQQVNCVLFIFLYNLFEEFTYIVPVIWANVTENDPCLYYFRKLSLRSLFDFTFGLIRDPLLLSGLKEKLITYLETKSETITYLSYS